MNDMRLTNSVYWTSAAKYFVWITTEKPESKKYRRRWIFSEEMWCASVYRKQDRWREGKQHMKEDVISEIEGELLHYLPALMH